MTSSTAPIRLQLSRRKSFNLQMLSLAINGLPAMNVARPSRWGNPFVVDADQPADEAVLAFEHDCDRAQVFRPERFREWITPLIGKNLACWCEPDATCHADVLLRLAAEFASAQETGRPDVAGRSLG